MRCHWCDIFVLACVSYTVYVLKTNIESFTTEKRTFWSKREMNHLPSIGIFDRKLDVSFFFGIYMPWKLPVWIETTTETHPSNTFRKNWGVTSCLTQCQSSQSDDGKLWPLATVNSVLTILVQRFGMQQSQSVQPTRSGPPPKNNKKQPKPRDITGSGQWHGLPVLQICEGKQSIFSKINRLMFHPTGTLKLTRSSPKIPMLFLIWFISFLGQCLTFLHR